MVEYKTASFFVAGKAHGHPVDEVDKYLNHMVEEGWEYVEMTTSALSTGIWIIVLFKK